MMIDMHLVQSGLQCAHDGCISCAGAGGAGAVRAGTAGIAVGAGSLRRRDRGRRRQSTEAGGSVCCEQVRPARWTTSTSNDKS